MSVNFSMNFSEAMRKLVVEGRWKVGQIQKCVGLLAVTIFVYVVT
jgi:hypothetical protein